MLKNFQRIKYVKLKKSARPKFPKQMCFCFFFKKLAGRLIFDGSLSFKKNRLVLLVMHFNRFSMNIRDKP